MPWQFSPRDERRPCAGPHRVVRRRSARPDTPRSRPLVCRPPPSLGCTGARRDGAAGESSDPLSWTGGNVGLKRWLSRRSPNCHRRAQTMVAPAPPTERGLHRQPVGRCEAETPPHPVAWCRRASQAPSAPKHRLQARRVPRRRASIRPTVPTDINSSVAGSGTGVGERVASNSDLSPAVKSEARNAY